MVELEKTDDIAVSSEDEVAEFTASLGDLGSVEDSDEEVETVNAQGETVDEGEIEGEQAVEVAGQIQGEQALEVEQARDTDQVMEHDFLIDENDLVYVTDSESESDENDVEANEDDRLKIKLREWAVNSGTPLCHMNSLLGILRPSFPSLPKDARTLLSTPIRHNLQDIAGGKFHYFGIQAGIELLLYRNDELGSHDRLSLQFNIDGLPLFKSSNDQFWPILGMIQEDPERKPFIIALWVGKSKPSNSNSFLERLVEELKSLENEGFHYQGVNIEIQAVNFVCDTPARAFVKKNKGHTGYYGCDNCIQSGEWVNSRVTFPEVDATDRTDVMFDEMVDEEHHHGATILRQLNLGLVSQFPLDYMHLVCLGVMKKMILLWIRGPLNVRVGGHVIELISNCLLQFQRYMPKEFNRKGRSLVDIDRWKATEFRTFLLYTGLVALKGKLRDVVYNNFVMLHVAITIFSSVELSSQYCGYAEHLLVMFVQHFGDIYGPQMLVYNVHSLIHLGRAVRKFGPIDKFSAFPYENYLKSIKGMIRKPNYPLQQVIRRLHEQRQVIKKSRQFQQSCKKPHVSGPLPPDFPPCRQFEEIHTEKYIIGTKQGDNALYIDGNLFIVKNVVAIHQDVRLLCQKFNSTQSFFHYPVDSLRLKIALVKDLSPDLLDFGLADISSKVVLLPYRDGFVCLPLVHTT